MSTEKPEHRCLSSWNCNCQDVEATKLSPSVVEWNKPQSTHTTEYDLIIKRNELPGHEKTHKKLKGTLLGERSQSGKAPCCMSPAVWHSAKGKTVETFKRHVVTRTWGEGGKDKQVEHRGLLMQWNYSVWPHNSGHVTGGIYRSPQNCVTPTRSTSTPVIQSEIFLPCFPPPTCNPP